jgi:enoyl-CoA hydratase
VIEDILVSGETIACSTDHIAARRSGSVGYLIFNRPERRNAVSLEMWLAIPEVMAVFNADPQIRSIVLAGAGREAFIAGADISEFENERKDAKAALAYEERNTAAYRAIAESPKSVIAMIDGFCIGGGVAIAAACDMRIAAIGSTFAVPAARLGLAYPPYAMGLLLRAVTPSRAKFLIHTARRLTAEEARDFGLVDKVVPREELGEYVAGLTSAIAENAPLTIAAANATIDALFAEGDVDENARRAIMACFDSEDYSEGRRAFIEKRKPVFQGK